MFKPHFLFATLTLFIISHKAFALDGCDTQAPPLHSGSGEMPVSSESRITLPFGSSLEGFYTFKKPHRGVDLARSNPQLVLREILEIKSPIIGCVIEAGFDKFLGNYAIVASSLDHDFRARKIAKALNNSDWEAKGIGLVPAGEVFSVLYAHLSEVNVEAGEFIDQGQMIGIMGETGEVTGIHVHMELKYGRQGVYTHGNTWRKTSYYDPMGFLYKVAGSEQRLFSELIDVTGSIVQDGVINSDVFPYPFFDR